MVVFNNLKMSNMTGAAVDTPVKPGLPSPSAFPIQTMTTYFGVHPTAHPSRNPKLVPVFHAIRCEEENSLQLTSISGRLTSSMALNMHQIEPAPITSGFSARPDLSPFTFLPAENAYVNG